MTDTPPLLHPLVERTIIARITTAASALPWWRIAAAALFLTLLFSAIPADEAFRLVWRAVDDIVESYGFEFLDMSAWEQTLVVLSALLDAAFEMGDPTKELTAPMYPVAMIGTCLGGGRSFA